MKSDKFGLEWQQQYMKELADFLIETADNCEDVRTWLKAKQQYRPAKLLPEIDSSDSDHSELLECEEESKVPKLPDDGRKVFFSKYPAALVDEMKS